MTEQNNNSDKFNVRKAALATFAAFAIGSGGTFIAAETMANEPEGIELLYDFIGGTAFATVVGAAAMDSRKEDPAWPNEMATPCQTTGEKD